jgi:hypothetical protein
MARLALLRRILSQPLVVGLGLGLGCLLLAGVVAWGWERMDRAAAERRRASKAVKAPRVGEVASDLRLPALTGPDREVRLGSLVGRKPVVLVFGSFSCLAFCKQLDRLERLYRDNKERAEFLFVNVREAGHVIPGLEFVIEGRTARFDIPMGVRRERTLRAMREKGFTLPAVIDPDDAPAEEAYDGFPVRLVVLDREGMVALDQGSGMPGEQPWDLSAVEEWLRARAEP